MREIEVKILDIDSVAVEKKLKEIGAVKSFDGEMHAIFFDFEDGSITRKGGLLRLRKEGEKTVLTHKQMISKAAAKIMDESETEVGNLPEMVEILHQLGLQKTRETRKFRTQYEWGNAHIVIDDYQGELAAIPPFVEIEASNEVLVEEAARKLGYTAADCKNWHTYDLIRHYGIKS